jgi:hypothetical protein
MYMKTPDALDDCRGEGLKKEKSIKKNWPKQYA